MKILLANPTCKQSINDKYEKYYIRSGSRWPHSGIKKKGTVPHYLPFPFYLAYSAAILRNSGFDVHTLDAIALDICEESFLSMLSDMNPDLLFFEVTTPTINYDLKLIRKIKAVVPQIIIAIGGAHATTFADKLIGDNLAINFVLKGEYELALNDLAISLRNNICSQDRGIISGNSSNSLDSFPFPAYDMFPSTTNPDPTVYWDGFCQMSPAIQMHSSRGCPHKCYFCLWNTVIYGHGKYRAIDPVRVVDQMEYLVNKYRIKEIYFDDDSFTINRDHVISICNELVKKNIDVNWSCMADVAGLDEELLGIMSQSGCIGVKFGVESASEKVLKGISKPVDLEKIKRIVSWCRMFKIKSHATFTIGLLDETEDDIRQTLYFAQNLRANSIQVSIATPFPGTKFYDVLKEKGLVKDDDWNSFDGKNSALEYLGLPKTVKLEKLRKRALFGWLLNTYLIPSNLIHHLQVVMRTMRGMGIRKFCGKLYSTVIDELKNR